MIITEGQDLRRLVDDGGRVVVPFSGGLDGTYALARLRSLCPDAAILAVTAGLGSDDPAPVAEIAGSLGVEHLFVEQTERLVSNWIAPAIRAEARYRGLFPVSSTLTRPVIVEALDLAVGLRPADVVVLTATPYQNTLFRMALPILARHRCHVFLPYAKNRVSRDEKLQVARSLGFTHRSTTHSIDENLWCRVIEEGGLQNPENPIPDDGVFAWTVDPATVTRDSRDMAIAFVDGLPTAIDGTPADLRGLIAHLNAEAGAYGIGRYTGLEETPLGYQNHEVREAPAATVIMAAHADLLRSTVGAMTASAFQDNAALWVELACWGHTETPLFRAVSAFITQLNQGMNGRVTMRLAPGSCFVVARQVPSPRCHHLPLSGAADVIAGLSLPAFMATVAHRV